MTENVKLLSLCEVLKRMGVPPHLKGYECIVEAVPYIMLRVPMAEIYRLVAVELKTTPWCVERNIRSAAEVSIDRIGQREIFEIYGNALPLSGKPSNAQLLVTAARMMNGMLPHSRSRNFEKMAI